MYKVSMVSLGCPKNQVDAEVMLKTLEDAVEYIENHSDEDEEGKEPKNFFTYEMEDGDPVHFYDNKGKKIW